MVSRFFLRHCAQSLDEWCPVFRNGLFVSSSSVEHTMKIIAHWQDAIPHNNEDLINAFSSCRNIVHISLPVRRDVIFNFVRQLEVFWEAWKMQGMLFEVAQSFRCECDVQRFRKSNVPRICPRAL
jgi:hypothetical protein